MSDDKPTSIVYGGPGTRKCGDCGVVSNQEGKWIGGVNEIQKWFCSCCAEDLMGLQRDEYGEVDHEWEQIPPDAPEDATKGGTTRPWNEEDQRLYEEAKARPRPWEKQR